MTRKNRPRTRSRGKPLKTYRARKRALNRERKIGRDIYFNVYPKHCVICGYSKIVEVHHIILISKFKIPKDGNGLENLAGLCPNHHAEFHSKLITIQEIYFAKTRMDEEIGLIPKVAT